MRIIGIDPGYAILGYGIIDYTPKTGLHYVVSGAIETASNLPFEQRLLIIHQGIQELLSIYQPHVMSIEELFLVKNTTTGIGTAHARGVSILAAAQAELPIFEYTPLQVKNNVAGYGKATKDQLQEMVRRLLHLSTIPKPDDASDALALAICQAYTGIKKEYLLTSGYQKGRPQGAKSLDTLKRKASKKGSP